MTVIMLSKALYLYLHHLRSPRSLLQYNVYVQRICLCIVWSCAFMQKIELHASIIDVLVHGLL